MDPKVFVDIELYEESFDELIRESPKTFFLLLFNFKDLLNECVAKQIRNNKNKIYFD